MARGSNFNDHLEESLMDPEYAAEFLTAALAEGDDDFLTEALALLVKVKGPSALSEETGITRQAFHKMFSNNGNPSFKNLKKILDAFGMQFTVTQKNKVS